MDAQPRASKYSARVDKSETNTSHALVLDLVGADKRVLDVGCASGYLAEALGAQGNKVSGVELDPEAAEKARPFLDRLVVGNVEDLDLVAEFGPGEFDVLVFADVLEHVKDPVDVLRRSRPLLAEGGYAVLSIPNVAHGSVRLALLRGRFDYQPLGLLDDTHLRFFTRSSLDRMVVDAGFVAVDTRQTTAGPFETEIPVARHDYPEAVVAAVEADQESRTYQFVTRVEPVDAAGSGLGEKLAERNRELYTLRSLLSDIARLAGDGPTHPVVGVLDTGGTELVALRVLRVETTRLELRRRLAGFEVRAYTLDPDQSGSGIGADGIQSLEPWHSGSAGDLRAVVDALVVLPGVPARAEAVLAELATAGIPVIRMGTRTEDPDVLAVAYRLVGSDVAAQRSEYLRVTGAIPAGTPYSLHSSGVGGNGRRSDQAVTTVRPQMDVSPLDLVGMVASAEAVAGDDPGMAALAAGLGRPTGGTGEDPELVRSRLGGAVDCYFDELYARLAVEAGRRLTATVPQRLGDLQARLALLESVNAGLAFTLGRERFAMATEVARLRALEDGAGPSRPNSMLVDRLNQELGRAAAEAARLEDEITRIYATRTMRAVAPVRRIYGRLRAIKP